MEKSDNFTSARLRRRVIVTRGQIYFLCNCNSENLIAAAASGAATEGVACRCAGIVKAAAKLLLALATIIIYSRVEKRCEIQVQLIKRLKNGGRGGAFKAPTGLRLAGSQRSGAIND